jgi:hypothetical protein
MKIQLNNQFKLLGV